MSEQGGRPTRPDDDWWGQLYDDSTHDTGPAPAADSLDDRFASASNTVATHPSTPAPAPSPASSAAPAGAPASGLGAGPAVETGTGVGGGAENGTGIGSESGDGKESGIGTGGGAGGVVPTQRTSGLPEVGRPDFGGPDTGGPGPGPRTAGPQGARPWAAGPQGADPWAAGLADAGLPEAGLSDAGPWGGGLRDAGPSGGGASDVDPWTAGLSDAGPWDGGLREAGPSGGGLREAGPSGAGSQVAGPSGAAPPDAVPWAAAPPEAVSVEPAPPTAGPPTAGSPDAEPSAAGSPTAEPSAAGPSAGGPPPAAPSAAGPLPARPSATPPPPAQPSPASPPSAAAPPDAEPRRRAPWEPPPAVPEPPSTFPPARRRHRAAAGSAPHPAQDPGPVSGAEWDSSGAGTRGGAAYVGSEPPTYDAEPTALPPADPDDLGALVADTVLDGARYGVCTLRAVSARGDLARFRGEPRRDALLTARFGTGDQALILVAMATGARGTPDAHRAAAEACDRIGRAVGSSHQRLVDDIHAARRGDLKSGLHRLTDRTLGKLRASAAEQGIPPQEYAADLRCLLLPAHPDCRTRVFFGVGDGGLFRLRDGAWQDIEPQVSRADTSGDAVLGFGSLPAETPDGDRLTMDLGIPTPPSPYEPVTEPPREPFRFRASVARPGDALLMCGGGLADPLRGEPALCAYLARRWSEGTAPGLADFLVDTQVRVKGYAEDRTAAAVWEA